MFIDGKVARARVKSMDTARVRAEPKRTLRIPD